MELEQRGIDPLARPIDKGSYMVLESPIPFAFLETIHMNLYYSNLICQGLSLILIIVPNAKLYYIQN